MVASIPAANPGVLVSAPVKIPMATGISTFANLKLKNAIKDADTITIVVSNTKVRPCFLKESKKPGPACIPMVYMNRTSPMEPIMGGIFTPKCPKKRATKMIAEISREIPATLMLPIIKPMQIITKRAT